MNEAKCCKALKDNAGAISALERVIQLEPGHPDAHYKLASLYKELQRPDDAIREYRRHLEVSP